MPPIGNFFTSCTLNYFGCRLQNYAKRNAAGRQILAGCGPGIVRLAFNEVIVPARPGVIDGGHDKPLHMLPAAGRSSGWSIQFDALPS